MPELMTLEQLAEIAGKQWRIVNGYLIWDRTETVVSLQNKTDIFIDGYSVGTIKPGKEREAIEAIKALRGCLE